ncbi:MAG: lipopolysaccharide assembly protein LapA domain-containing protein [Acinetobacter sp.]|nr:lipopolysaccharide assembly protein LapA domain-containing protein [Acinetobacter sp.]
MRYIFVILLFALLGYSAFLVYFNSAEVTVDLVFNQLIAMRLGLVLLLSLALGVVLGLLFGLQLFKVFQSQWEIKRLRKEIDVLKQTQMDAVAAKALNHAREHEKLDAEKALHQQENLTNKSPE